MQPATLSAVERRAGAEGARRFGDTDSGPTVTEELSAAFVLPDEVVPHELPLGASSNPNHWCRQPFLHIILVCCTKDEYKVRPLRPFTTPALDRKPAPAPTPWANSRDGTRSRGRRKASTSA